MFTIFVIFFFFFLITPAVAGLENPLVELSSREEFINQAGYGEAKLSTVLVSGTLVCDACSDGTKLELHRRPVSGASVAVSCHPGRKTRKSNWVGGTTDEYGEFLIDLPSHLHAITNLENICLVNVLELPKNSPCHHSFTGKHKRIKLSSIEDGVRTYTSQKIHMSPTSSHGCKNIGRRKKMADA